MIRNVEALLLERYQVRVSTGSLASLLGIRCDEFGKVVDYETSGLLSTGSNEYVMSELTGHIHGLGLPRREAAAVAEESCRLAHVEIDRMRPIEARERLVEFLDQCLSQQLVMAVVTADDTANAVKHLDWLGIRQYFAVVVGHDMVSLGKPHPDMVRLACDKLGLSPADVAVIGDTESDMKMGKAAGVAFTIAILPESRPSTDQVLSAYESADMVIASYGQMLGPGRE